MTTIKDITGLTKEFQRIRKTDEMRRERANPKAPKSPNAPSTRSLSEKVSISNAAKKLFEQQQSIDQQQNPNKGFQKLGQEKLTQVQDRMASGHYSTPEVVEHVADELMALPMFQATQAQRNGENENLDKTRKFAEINEKIKNGEYDSEVVLDVIVEKLSGEL